MWPFGARARLVRALDSLAFYNDKGISYSRHSPAQVEVERAARLDRIRELVGSIGAERLPSEFLAALDSGDLAVDMTGQYVAAVRAHLRRRHAL